MDLLVRIFEILVWPMTLLIAVAMLRKPISELVPTLKKLKYKDLELEFEREAQKILAEAERDLPEIEKTVEPSPEPEPGEPPMFSIRIDEPPVRIMKAWRSIELEIRKLAGKHNIQTGKSIRSLVSSLLSNELLTEELSKVILELAALRNKVTHTDEEIITFETASAFDKTADRVLEVLHEKNA